MKQTDSGYIYGTSPKKLKYDVYETNPVLKARKANKIKKKAKARLVLYTVVFFILAFILIYRYTMLTDVNYRIIKLEKTYENIRVANMHAQVEIGKATDLEKIREIAEGRLGMQKPDRAQIVYVNVPKEDVTSVSDVYKSKNTGGNGFFAVVFDKIVKFFGLIS